MNQRFEDTYDKATDAICGMAKDYRILEERHRQLADRFVHLEDVRDDLRNKLSDALGKLEQPIAGEWDFDECASCVHKHPEFLKEKFTLIEPGRLIEHEESDIDLAVPERELAPKAPILYDQYFDVLMWRWIFNTAYPDGGRVITVLSRPNLRATEEEARRLDPT